MLHDKAIRYSRTETGTRDSEDVERSIADIAPLDGYEFAQDEMEGELRRAGNTKEDLLGVSSECRQMTKH